MAAPRDKIFTILARSYGENPKRQEIDMIYRITTKTKALGCLNLVNPVDPVHSGFALVCVHRRSSAVASDL
jgi:hypothetical protein